MSHRLRRTHRGGGIEERTQGFRVALEWFRRDPQSDPVFDPATSFKIPNGGGMNGNGRNRGNGHETTEPSESGTIDEMCEHLDQLITVLYENSSPLVLEVIEEMRDCVGWLVDEYETENEELRNICEIERRSKRAIAEDIHKRFEQLTAGYENKIKKLTTDYEAIIRNLKKQLNAQKGAVDSEVLDKMREHVEMLSDAYQSELDGLKQAHREEIGQLRQALRSSKDNAKGTVAGSIRKIRALNAQLQDAQEEVAELRQANEVKDLVQHTSAAKARVEIRQLKVKLRTEKELRIRAQEEAKKLCQDIESAKVKVRKLMIGTRENTQLIEAGNENRIVKIADLESSLEQAEAKVADHAELEDKLEQLIQRLGLLIQAKAEAKTVKRQQDIEAAEEEIGELRGYIETMSIRVQEHNLAADAKKDKKIEAMTAQNAALVLKNERLEKRLQAAEASRCKTEVALRQSEGRGHEARQEAANKDKQLEEVKGQLARSQKSDKQARVKLKKAQESESQALKNNNQLRRAVDEMKAEIIDLKRKLANLQILFELEESKAKRYKQNEKDARGRLEPFISKVASLEDELRQEREMTKANADEAVELKKELASLEENYRSLSSRHNHMVGVYLDILESNQITNGHLGLSKMERALNHLGLNSKASPEQVKAVRDMLGFALHTDRLPSGLKERCERLGILTVFHGKIGEVNSAAKYVLKEIASGGNRGVSDQN